MPKRRRQARSPDLNGLAGIWRAGRGPIGFLPAPLFRDRAPLVAIVVAWLLAFGGSVLIGFVLTRLVPGGAGPDLGLDDAPAPVLLAAIALFSPVVETLLMGVALDLLRRVVRPGVAVVASAIGWGVAHSLMAPLWGAVIWWPFLIFSTLFVTWRGYGFWRAAAMAAAVHILQNSAPAVAMVMGY